MTLGQKINQLRLEHNLSQNDLADMLNVSRQSISKWETDGSVPDLDNLIKLSQIFHVTLDELVLNKKSDNIVTTETTTAATASLPNSTEGRNVQGGLPVRILAGFALLICSAVGIIICTILGDPAAGLVLMLPFMISALICFTVPKHTELVVFWVLSIVLDAFFRFGTDINWHLTRMLFDPRYMAGGFTIQMLIAIIEVIWLCILIFITIRRFRNGTALQPKSLAIAWALYIGARFLVSRGLTLIVQKLSMTSLFGTAMGLYVILYLIVDWLFVGALTVLLIQTFRWIRTVKIK